MRANKVYIIGVAPGGASSLSPESLRRVEAAELVFGGERLLRMFPSLSAAKVVIKANLAEVARRIKLNLGQKRMVVLASGDPGFYGIARYLTGKLGKDVFAVIPNVSAMQIAFARIGESWEDAAFTSVHSRPIADIVALVRSTRKIGIFTDDEHTPAEVARVLLESGLEDCRAYVCQDLGTAQEKVVATGLVKMTKMAFSPLNVVVLLRDKAEPLTQLVGIPDVEFAQPGEGGLITKLEVRAISLAKLGLKRDSVVWDIGAGSGSVSVEASLLAVTGQVFAVEKNSEAIAAIKENTGKFARDNIKVVHALAPEGMEKLPDPDAIFIGGSGGRMAEILRLASRRLKPGGRIVINAATLETLHAATDGLKSNGFTVEVSLVNVSRSKDVLDLTRFEALNPVFVISGGRKTDGE